MTARKKAARKRTAKRKVARTKPLAEKGPVAGGAPIRHVVLLMLENRSFDQMLGLLQGQLPLDGVPPGPPTRSNTHDGHRYDQRVGAVRKVDPDPPHEFRYVKEALGNGNAGFVASYARKHPGSSVAQRQQVMSCYAPDELLSLHTLARSFVVCDAWHCSVPGPTWPNRLFAMSGTSLGRLDMPAGLFQPNLHRYRQPSVFRRLAEANRRYRIYFGDFPLALLLEDQRRPRAGTHYARLGDFAKHAKKPEPEFPEFVFIEPDYLWPGANDDHPPHDVQRGQSLMADVYDAIRANPALWESTLLVVTYDEHGGFYDHVVPAAGDTIAPDASPGEHDFGFDQLGVRVPAVLVSPWLDPGVLHDRFGHTSLLRMLQDLWGIGDLGKRAADARSPLAALRLRAAPRADTPQKLPRPLGPKVKKLTAKAPEAFVPLNDHQQAILAFSDYLETLAPPPPKKQALLAKKKHLGPAASSAVAQERAVRFLRKRGARL